MDAPRRTIARAKSLRRAMTPPELRLWLALRGKAVEGLRFRRQHPLGPFILDFYCAEAELAVEIDGAGHYLGDNPARDLARDRWMERRGVETLRIPAIEVRDDLDGVIAQIVGRARARIGGG